MFDENLIDITYSKTYVNNISSFKNSINADIDDACLKSLSGKLVYNFDTTSGVLKDGIGIGDVVFKYGTQQFRRLKKVVFPENYQVMACWHFPYFDSFVGEDNPAFIIYCSNRKFYFIFIQNQDTNMIEIPNLLFYDVPMAVCSKINGIDSMIFVSARDGMYTWSPLNGAEKIDNAPLMTSMCSEYDRIFATVAEDKKTVVYSESLNPTNFNTSDNQGGVISLNDDFGYCNKVVSFKGYVYIFRDYNIAKITAYGDGNEFAVSQLYVSNGKIFAGTICACGDKILYLASDGLYSFDGSKSTKIDLKINSLFTGNENEMAKANFSCGIYYLACRMNFDDDAKESCENRDYVNNALLKYSLDSGEFVIMRGYDIRNIVTINDNIESYVLVIYHDGIGLLVGMLNMNGMFYDTPTHKVWTTTKTDFNYPTKNKILREISFESATDGCVKIWCDGIEKEFSFIGSNTSQKIKPYIRGKKFSISFQVSSSGARIVKPSVKVGVIC